MVSVLGWRSLILSILFSLSWSLVARSDTGIDQLPFECVVNTGSTPVPVSSEEASGETLEKLRVSGFEFVGNTVFSQDTLNEAIADFTEREISFVELIEAVSRITQKYNDQGYINSYAVPYPQKVSDGVVKIAVIEGGLGSIFLTRQGKGRLHPNYICDRLAIAAKPLNLNHLLDALRLLQLDPLIRNISAELVPGAKPESNHLNVQFEEAKTLSIQIGGDNGRSPSVGSFRRQIEVKQENLLGLGDGLSIGYANTDGSHTFYADYDLPLNPRNGTLSFAYGMASNRVIEPPFEPIDLRGDSRYFQVGFRQPIYEKPDQVLALGVSLSRQESDTYLLGKPFPLSEGASRRGEIRATVLRFDQEGLWRSDRQILAVRSQFSLGLDLFGSTVRSEAPDGRFFAWRGQGQWIRQFIPDQLLLLRGDIQLADRALIPIEQFSIGGLESVRGYRQDVRLTDNGIFLSAEFRHPLIGKSDQKWGVLQITPFVDFGTAWNSSRRPNLQPQTLVSGGLGLRWQWGQYTHASLYWGIPFVEVESRDRTWQENGLYFLVQTRFFF